MASGTADLQRDLGGAIMQSIFGALLTAGYAAAVGGGDRRRAEQRAGHRQRPEPSSRSRSPAPRPSPQQYPQYATQITAAAKQSFLDGDQWAYTAGDRRGPARRGCSSSSCFPRKDEEERLLAEYHAEDTAERPSSGP